MAVNKNKWTKATALENYKLWTNDKALLKVLLEKQTKEELTKAEIKKMINNELKRVVN